MILHRVYLFIGIFLIGANATPKSGYIMTSPAVFRAGVEHGVNVRLFDHDEAVRVYVKLVDLRENLIASASEEITHSGLLSIQVPDGKSGKANLRICGNCHTDNDFKFSNSTPVTIVNKGSSAFLQTDKPIYKPSQTVNVNIITINRDLKPVNKNVTAYVVAPNNVRMFQWKGLKESCCGVRSFSFELSDQPVLGLWTIFADIQEHSYNTTFEIREYVQPRFEVVISPPPFFRADCEVVEVGSRYLFGEPVVGNLSANFTVHGVGYSREAYLEKGPTLTFNMEINGTASIQICQSSLLPPNLSPHFRGELSIHATVTGSDGNAFTATDATTPVSQHEVAIEFGADTRQHFKPGIPFKGKIIASYLDGSRAPRVAVLLNVEVDRGSFFREEATSDANGEITFQVPGLPAFTQLVWVEARVFSIAGVLVGAHYQSIYRNLHKWSSPSGCYLLAQGPDEKLVSGHTARVSVKSNCACNFTLYHETVARGNILSTGWQHVAHGDGHRGSRHRGNRVSYHANHGRDVEICETSLSIEVTPGMAPLARMLVYYVTEGGEGVADMIHLPVEARLQNEVTIESTPTHSKPGEKVGIRVDSNPGSCVCLALVDQSVHLLKPGYMLTPQQIFAELHSYDADNLPFEREIDWWKLAARHRRDASVWWASERDSKFAFLEAGLVVMTNAVALDNRATSLLFPHLLTQSMQQIIRGRDEPQGGAAEQRSRIIKRKRTYFPETWFWKCFNTSSGSQQLNLTLPDSITTWRADAFSLDPVGGIGVSPPLLLRSSKAFFVDLKLPYSVVRGEGVEALVTAYNYLDSCVKVSLSVLLPFGVDFRHHGNRRKVSRLCIGPRSSRTVPVALQFAFLGTRNISAFAHIVTGTCCGNKVTTVVNKESDFVTRSVVVKPEGVSRDYVHSVYFCPNERINITTPVSFTFQFVKLPGNLTGFSFLTRASEEVHIVLTSSDHRSPSSFEIILGGSHNLRSSLSRSSHTLVSASTPRILSGEQFRSFWVRWEGGNVEVGTGSSHNPSSRLMQWRGGDVGVESVGFATGEGVAGEFLLWRKEESGKSFNDVFMLRVPTNVVKGSTRAVASVIGDVMGPTLKNLNNLLTLPYGCGEQNLIKFAPNIYVLNYLKATRQLTYEVEQRATQYLVTGYQRQLTYKRFDGSYSPFGDKDTAGSMWLTAFVLKSFSQARHLIFIDPNEISDIKEWVFSRQRADGSFPAEGKVWNRGSQAGKDREVALTAYVVIAMLEAGLESEKEEIAMKEARESLELRVFNVTDSYTLSIAAYALTLQGSSYAAGAQQRLMGRARVGGGEMHWGSGEELAFGDNLFGFVDPINQTVISAEVEMTSYALLMFTHDQNATAALPVVKWLSRNRNAIGGFSSTQDTCVALSALSEYAIFSFVGGVNLNVSLVATNYAAYFRLDNDNSEVLQSDAIPSLPITLLLDSTGYGCALLQINVDYNIPTPEEQSDFYLSVRHRKLLADNIASARARYEVSVCVRWLHSGSSNMAVVEFNLLTGVRPDLESIQKLTAAEGNGLMRYEVQGRSILFYFDEVHSTCRSCVEFVTTTEFVTENAQAQSVKVFDYYEPVYTKEINYSPDLSLACHVDDESCISNEEQQDCGASDCPSDAFAECHCGHDCGFEGPSVCGSNGQVYINECRLGAAACELGLEIQPRDFMFCEEASEAANEAPPPTGSPAPPKTQQDYFYYDNSYLNYLSDDGNTHPAEDLYNPDVMEPIWKV